MAPRPSQPAAGRIARGNDAPWSLAPVARWLLLEGWQHGDSGELLEAFAERLVDAGIPLARVGVFFIALHPEVLGNSYIWRGPGTRVENQRIPHGYEQTDDFRLSPLIAIFEGTADQIRERIDQLPTDHLYPVYRDMRAQGVRDYLCLPIQFSDGRRHAISFTTQDPAGFSEPHLRELRDSVVVLQRILEAHAMRRVSEVLLRTYVGAQAGVRILDGQITRGSSESIRALIWMSDLRGFTPMSDRLPREVLIRCLNRYFDCVVPPIQRSGGEVLKFIGDAVLGIWRIADPADAPALALRALEAAREAETKLREVNQELESSSTPALDFGVALHVGEVMYGNIGARSRLDFTVIGPAVNLVSRLEQLTKVLAPTLASADFAKLCDPPLLNLGVHTLPGVVAQQEIFGLP